jgi:hypothetical protein
MEHAVFPALADCLQEQQYAPVILLAAQPPAAESKRLATGTASGLTTKDDAMLTFERAPKSQTPKFSFS